MKVCVYTWASRWPDLMAVVRTVLAVAIRRGACGDFRSVPWDARTVQCHDDLSAFCVRRQDQFKGGIVEATFVTELHGFDLP
jgi:hypothetical protein